MNIGVHSSRGLGGRSMHEIYVPTYAPIQITMATRLQKLYYSFNTKTLLYNHKKEKHIYFMSTACDEVPWTQNYQLRTQNLVDL